MSRAKSPCATANERRIRLERCRAATSALARPPCGASIPKTTAIRDTLVRPAIACDRSPRPRVSIERKEGRCCGRGLRFVVPDGVAFLIVSPRLSIGADFLCFSGFFLLQSVPTYATLNAEALSSLAWRHQVRQDARTDFALWLGGGERSGVLLIPSQTASFDASQKLQPSRVTSYATMILLSRV